MNANISVFSRISQDEFFVFYISQLLIFELNQTTVHFALFDVQGDPNYQFACIALRGKFEP